ncbi:MAG: hybrid sensor histidine kinase/response regulator [Flavobacteriaceae bacterium]|nr:MAG: hybrid sensor histidine kinase/response regulator [Flavobacteriaceae bacterium]
MVTSCSNKQTSIELSNNPLNLQLDVNAEIKDTTNINFEETSKNLEVNYFVEQLDNTKGLSNSSVNTIFQDSENLLWIGTWDGLNRYDGGNFKIFRPELNNENSLSNQVILKIGEDITGQIWILTMQGINRYNKKNNIFKRYYFSRKNDPPLTESEFNIAFDASKKVFCMVKDWGIGYFNGNDFQLLNANNLPKESVKKMKFLPTGELLVLYENNQLYSLVFDTDNTGKMIISKVEIVSGGIREFGILPNQKICIIPIIGDSEIYSLLDKNKQTISVKNIKKIIGQTTNGLVVSNKSEYFIINSKGISVNKLWLKRLKNQKITTLTQGSENIIWTGTDGDGIFKMYPLRKSFNLISKTKVPELDGGIVRSFLKIEGNSFWVGTKGKGLFKFPYNFYEISNESLKYETFNESNSLINNAVFSLSKGKDNLVFIGTDGIGINVYDLKKSKLINWSEIEGKEKCELFKSTYAIYQDEKGFLWIGTNGYGMIRFKIERAGEKLKVTQFKRYLADNDVGGSISSNIIFSIVPKNKNELWIGTRLGGLNLFDKESGLFETYKRDKDNPKSLSSNDILCLNVDDDGKLWVGTSFGLNLLENFEKGSKAVFKSFTVKEGLPNNTIHGIVSDKKSNLWISTNFGLSNFIVDKSKFINYTKNEGLQNNEFADGAYYQDLESDFIFMGGIKGFNYFLPSKIVESTIIPDILIDKISGQNQQVPYYQGLVVSPNSKIVPSIVLEHDQNFFDVELAALTYINSEKCEYAYKMSNFDKNWNTINNRRIISFTNVPYGSYSLWIKWSNSDGVWSQPVQAIDIKIKPVFWRSNIAIALYFIFLFLLILLIVSYYQKQELLRKNILFRKKDEETHQNRLTFFTNIAHELQTPLTLIVGPAQKLAESIDINEKNQRFIKMIQRNSSRLLFLTQQLLEFRKAEFDYLEVIVKQFNLINLVEQIAELFDEWALQKKINYTVEIPSELEGWYDKDKIEKIVFNLLSNAFKYTPENGQIKLKFFIEDLPSKILNIMVVNSGKGLSKDNLDSLFDRFFLADKTGGTPGDLFRTGIGLAYIKKLVTVLRGDIIVDSKENKYTTFIISLPCDKEAFEDKELDKELNKEETQIFISHHLQNILEDSYTDSSNKVSTLEAILNERKVVLIVEDEIEIQALINEMLKEKYKILMASNGVEALKIVETNIPDIIISDVMMPEMDGLEFCRKIKKNIKTCHIPFILLTAKSSVINRIEGLESGANSYIPKPFYPEHLLVRIQNLLEEKELIQNHFKKGSFDENLTNIPVEAAEKSFMKKLLNLIQANIENENLQSSFLEKELGMSSSHLYRKIKQLFGIAPGDLIRTVRLKHAAELLKKSTLTVSEICYKSGFNNRSYFYREFKKMYDITPKNYQIKFKSIF